MSDPFEMLMAEHRVIEKVLDALEAAAHADISFPFYERAVDFIARFADGCHHAKEEDRLFPLLVERGIPHEHGPIGVMLHEHESGRSHLKAMREMIAARDLDGLRRGGLSYAALMRDHIRKEDEVLFPIGRSILRPEELASLAEGFAAVVPPTGTCAEYEALADALAREVGAPA
jgi:hemerythrin-like domain-containing protein